MVLVAAAGGAVAQSSYPGGLAQWANDARGPARVSEARARVAIRDALATTQAQTWHSKTTSQGSTFEYSDSDELVTAAHVLPAPLVKLTVIDGAGNTHPADLLTKDGLDDLAVLRVEGMSGTVLKPSQHPLYARSRIYVGGIGATGSGAVLSGQVKSVDYSGSLDGVPVNHAILATVSPVTQSMDGGPVVDEWGGVVGVLLGATAGGGDVLIVPLKTLALVASNTLVGANPLYIGPPLITTAAQQLVLGPDKFPNRNAKQDRNQTTFLVGSTSSSTFSQGDMWVGVFPTIADAAAAAGKCLASLGKGWPRVSSAAYPIGDGGHVILANDSYGTYTLLLCWSDRNVEAIWWIEARGGDQRAFFSQIAYAQEAVLYDAK